MGLEAQCLARHGSQAGEGKLQLEGSELLFRGAFRLKIQVSEITRLEAKGSSLHVAFGSGRAVFQLGSAKDVEKWIGKIRNPPSLLDKLGVKPGMRVGAVDLRDGGFLGDLSKVAAEVHTGMLPRGLDLVFLGVESVEALAGLRGMEHHITQAGGIWVIYPKGSKAVTQSDVMAAMASVALVDVKVASFSATHTALKAVIPVHRRS
ncbi:MAG: hypothetical protein FJW40_06470 [Acidobacteria bacterium]|nr:hypothetical protein [Acidobacteriota bacterium]